jgi:SAM-dependent methyltransferase
MDGPIMVHACGMGPAGLGSVPRFDLAAPAVTTGKAMTALRAPRTDIRTPLYPLWPSEPPPGYRGQLTDEHQAALAAARAGLSLEECSFYHATTLSDGTTVPGAWDHRGTEAEYLGEETLAGCRVLEPGPASGHFTSFMEQRGADVVSFEAGYDRMIDLLPPVPSDGYDDLRERLMGELVGVNNAWWYLHRDRNLRARIAYGDVYDLPDDLGTFDVAFFGSILLHLRDPFQALEQAARRTTDRLIVTDMLYTDLVPADGLLGLAGRVRRRLARTVGRPGAGDPHNLLRFAPEQDNPGVSTLWWHFSPAAVANMLRRLGFVGIRTTYHAQSYRVRHEPDAEPTSVAMFTVVGRR